MIYLEIKKMFIFIPGKKSKVKRLQAPPQLDVKRWLKNGDLGDFLSELGNHSRETFMIV